jgi:cytochrome c oxidase subunit 3
MREELKKASASPRLEKAPFNLTPGRTILLVLMGGSFMMFVFLTLNMMIHSFRLGKSTGLPLPEPFVVSTWVLLISSFVLRKTRDLYLEENLQATRRNLSIALALLALFTVLQTTAWVQIIKVLDYLEASRTLAHYIFAVSGLHLLHVMVALGMVGSVWYHFVRLRHNPVADLILFTDKGLYARFRNAEIFCHYADALWILIFISLLIIV